MSKSTNATPQPRPGDDNSVWAEGFCSPACIGQPVMFGKLASVELDHQYCLKSGYKEYPHIHEGPYKAKSIWDSATPEALSGEKIEYYRTEAKACKGGLDCRGWSCIPIVELLATIDALKPQPAPVPSTLCPVCGSGFIVRQSGPLPGCPQGISTSVCATDPSHASEEPKSAPAAPVPLTERCVCGHEKSQHREMKSAEPGMGGWVLGCLAENCACGPGCIHEGFVSSSGGGSPHSVKPTATVPLAEDEALIARFKEIVTFCNTMGPRGSISVNDLGTLGNILERLSLRSGQLAQAALQVTEEAVKRGTNAALAVDVGPGSPDLCCSIPDYPYPVAATCYLFAHQMEKIVRAALAAALTTEEQKR